MKRPGVTTVYHAKDGWRWRGVIGGRIVAESAEAYQRRARCREMAVKYGPSGFRIVVKE